MACSSQWRRSAVVAGCLFGARAGRAQPSGSDDQLAFDQIDLGENHGCGRRPDGQVACWGAADRGQNGATHASSSPMAVEGLRDVAALSAGDMHTCAVRLDGSVWCWGDNATGQLGSPAGGPRSTPESVFGIGPIQSVSAGASHTCAVLIDGGVACWGDNLFGQLGTLGLKSSPFPLPVPGVQGAFAVAAGHGHTCAAIRREEGEQVICWGDGGQGQLGRPASADPQAPGTVNWPFERLRGIDARGHRTCAVTADGVVCWGVEGGAAESPTQVVTAPGLVTVAVGWGHACALAGAGTVTCWGDDNLGQHGARVAGTVTSPAYGLHDAVSVAAGRGISCAARQTGRAACWGSYSAEEVAAADRERPGLLSPARQVVRQLPPGTTLQVRADEVLSPSGSHARVVMQTVEPQACANAQIAVEAKVTRHSVVLTLGEVFLPDGACLAANAPASASWNLPQEARGRTDVLIRWRKREDFFQLYVTPSKIEAIPLQSTFARWSDDAALWRVPAGAVAISCVDHLEAPVCQRRARDGLATCRTLYADARVADAAELADHAWANTWFGEDPGATRIADAGDAATLRELFVRDYADGSGCFEVTARAWTGETWSNQ